MAGLTAVSAVLALLRFDSFPVGGFVDDAHYAVLAEGIVQGQGLRLVNYPQAPPEPNFPPGWPLLLSPLVAVAPGNYAVLKGLSLVLWLATLPLIYRLIAVRLASPNRELYMTLVAISPALVGMSAMVMSESAYLFFSMVTLCLVERWHRSQQQRAAGASLLLALGTAAAIFTHQIRTVGVALVAAVLVYVALQRRHHALVLVLALTTLDAAWQVWFNAQNGGVLVPGGYQSQVLNATLGQKLAHVWENAHSYAGGMLSEAVIPLSFSSQSGNSLPHGVLAIGNVLLVTTLLIGAALSSRNGTLVDLYVLCYGLAILTFWNPLTGSSQRRFLIPLIPFLYYYLLLALAALSWLTRALRNYDGTLARTVVPAAAVVIVGMSSIRNVQDWLRPIRLRMTDPSLGASWIRGNTPADAVVMARDPVPAYLYARRKTVGYPPVAEDARAVLNAGGVNYVIVSPKLEMHPSYEIDTATLSGLLPALTADPPKARIVYADTAHHVTVYELTK